MAKPNIAKRIERQCSISVDECPRRGKPMRVVIYEDGTYRGGHYFNFGEEWERQHGEYWECPACYWGLRRRLMKDKKEVSNVEKI